MQDEGYTPEQNERWTAWRRAVRVDAQRTAWVAPVAGAVMLTVALVVLTLLR
jgi:hypothetical protein